MEWLGWIPVMRPRERQASACRGSRSPPSSTPRQAHAVPLSQTGHTAFFLAVDLKWWKMGRSLCCQTWGPRIELEMVVAPGAGASGFTIQKRTTPASQRANRGCGLQSVASITRGSCHRRHYAVFIAAPRMRLVVGRMTRGSTCSAFSRDARTSLPEIETGFSSLCSSHKSTRPHDS